MDKLKLVTFVGTRPEVIRLSEVIRVCDECFDHLLVHTGQNYDYELNQGIFEDLKLRAPDANLDVAGEDLGQTLGAVIAKSYAFLVEQKPDCVLVLGDTNSCLAAISAKRLHIPIFHMEAGNRCFDVRLPEETNRRIIDHTADVNLCYSEHARRNLLAEGLPTQYTFVTGSPMKDVLDAHKDRIFASDAVERLGLEPHQYALLSAHREENIDDINRFMSLMEAVNQLAEAYNMPVLYSVHPRSAKAIEERGFTFHPNVVTHAPLNFTDYNKLQMESKLVLSDSGTLPEEAAWYAAQGRQLAAVALRTSTERPEAMESGVFTIGSVGADTVLQASQFAMSMVDAGNMPDKVPDYVRENVAGKVARIIQSYTPVINEMVWRKR